jgi:hypothetical protein
MRGKMRVSHLLLSVALSGCTWISKTDMESREPGLDNDGDGVVASKDCDDNDPDVSPRKAETWYDGVDGDCANDDDYDADKDGYVPTQYVGMQTAGVKATGILPPGDCADNDGSVHPNAVDEFYDGVDTDCAGNDDFDQDEDGYASMAHDYTSTEYANGTGSLANTDCDDTIDTVNPGATDTPYSGIDEDCAGNDDYDLDDDGFYDDSMPIFYTETTYAPGTGIALPGDCDDENPSVFIGAVDAFYDGIDSDCTGNDDFDQDFDGFVQDVHIGQMTEYVPSSGLLDGGDCNDDPESGGALAFPSAMEVLADDVDHDCDALSAEIGANTFRLTLADDLNFIGVHSMKFGENATGIHLAIGADESETNEDGIIRAVTFDATDPSGVEPSVTTLNEGSASTSNPYTLASAMSFWVDEDVHLSLTGGIWFNIGMRALYLRGFDDITGVPTGAAVGPDAEDADVAEWEQMSDVHLFRDSFSDFHAVGCDLSTQVIHYNTATNASLHLGGSDLPSYDTVRHTGDFPASQCAMFERSGQVVILSNLEGSFTASTIDPLTTTLTIDSDPATTGLPSPDPALAAADIIDIVVPAARAPESVFVVSDDFNNDVLVVNEDFEVIQSMNLAVSPVSLDAVFAPDGTLYVLAVDESGHGWLSWGALDEALSAPLQLGADDLTSAALWIDDATGNILQIAATVAEPASSADPIYWGAAYLDSPS